MSKLYLLINGEEKGPYSEDQVRAMYLAGTLTSDVHYWQEGQTEWLPIDTLFTSKTAEQPELTAPSFSQPNTKVEQSKKNPLIILLIIAGVLASIALGFYLFNKHQEEEVRKQEQIAKQQRQIPLEIMRAINNLSSATSTGINQETYTNLVIALKSAVATYGQNLPSDEAHLLTKIVDTYDIGVQLWDKAQTDEDGISIIVLDISRDADLDTVVKNLGVPSQVVAVYNENDTTHHQYFRSDVLSRLWTLNDAAVKALTGGVDNKNVINSFNSPPPPEQTTDLAQKAVAEPTVDVERTQSFTIDPASKVQILRLKDDVDAVTSLTKAAEQGDAESENSLGVMYERGHGVSRDFTSAMSWFSKAAAQGNAEAEFHLGMMYVNGRGVPKDSTQGLEWITKSANQNYAIAEDRLGGMYARGTNVTKDSSVALQWYTKAANQNNSDAQYFVGNMYQTGQGTDINNEEGNKWLEKAASNKNSEASYALGYYYQTATGANQDYAKALQWYTESANEGNPEAQHAIGVFYDEGLGVAQDHATAFKWYLKSANQGLGRAETLVGGCYFQGDGVTKDVSAALGWFESAVNHGEKGKDMELLLAGISLIQLLDNNQHPEQTIQAKANNGNSTAEYAMGLAYETGSGVTKDDNAAVDWFQKAAAQGNDDAKDKLLIRKYKAGNPLTASEWKIVLTHHTSILSLYEAIGNSDDSFKEDLHTVRLYYNKAVNEDGTQTNDVYVTVDLLKTTDGDFQAGPAAFRIKGQPTVMLY